MSYGQNSSDSDEYCIFQYKTQSKLKGRTVGNRAIFQKEKDVAALDFEMQANQIGKFRKHLTVFI